MNADVARKTTDTARSQNGEYLKAETEAILRTVEHAAHIDHDSVTTAYTDIVIRQRLTALGYTVKYESDQRETHAYLRVSW
jgi:uncharacterized protein YaaN involved in tellurite resistance